MLEPLRTAFQQYKNKNNLFWSSGQLRMFLNFNFDYFYLFCGNSWPSRVAQYWIEFWNVDIMGHVKLTKSAGVSI